MSHFQSEKIASFFTTQTTVESIKPDSRNPRVHSPKQIKQIARSIQSFGFNVPILIDKESKILCGHGRYLAAKQLGMSEVSKGEHPPQLTAKKLISHLPLPADWGEQRTLLGVTER